MPWTETAPGRFERDFGCLENFYRAIGAAAAPLQREHFQLQCIARIEPVPSHLALRLAWKALRSRHPLLAGTAEGDKYVYKVPDAESLESWTNETCHYRAASDKSTVNELISSAKPIDGIHISLLASTGDVLIQSNHWRMDGIGVLNLTHELLEIFANPVPDATLQWTSEQAFPKLTPAIDEIINAPKEATEERQSQAKQLMDIVSQNPATMAFKAMPNQLPTTTGRLNLTLSEDDTSKVIKACKARGITVSVGMHAALVLAGKRLDEGQARTDDGKYVYTDLLTFSARKYLPPPYDSRRVPVTTYHQGVPTTVDVVNDDKAKSLGTKPLGSSSLTFSHVASELAKTYKFDIPGTFDYFVQWVNTIVAFYSTPPGADGPPPPALPDLSVLGILEDNVQRVYEGEKRFELLNWAITIEILDRHVFCHNWTFRDKLELQARWNEAFYDREFAGRLVHEWKAVILEELCS